MSHPGSSSYIKKLANTFVSHIVASRVFAGRRIAGIVKAEKAAEQAAKGYWKKLGPGLTTGAADDDPSGIATYSQAGAQFSFNLAWLAIFTYPLMSVVQEMCARIGLVTSRGLAANIRMHYSRGVLYVVALLLFAANTFNIGANLGAMAEATRLVFPHFSFIWLVIGFTVFSVLLQIFTTYKTYAGYLKWLALILFAYVVTAFVVNLDWSQILKEVVWPEIIFDRSTILMIAAILGTTISPYLFFWQTSQEVEERILHGQVVEETVEVKTLIDEQGRVVRQEESVEHVEVPVPVISDVSDIELKDMRVDVWSGMFISNMVMFFIIVVCGAILHKGGITTINSAADAARALEPLAGQWAYLLFAIGIIGTGLLAVPILAGSTSYALAESFKWKSGLHYRLKEAYAFYIVIILSMVVGLLLNFIGFDPIKALIYSAILNCIVAPIVLVFIVQLSSSSDVMGKYVNSVRGKVLGWGITVIMAIVGIVTVGLLFT